MLFKVVSQYMQVMLLLTTDINKILSTIYCYGSVQGLHKTADIGTGLRLLMCACTSIVASFPSLPRFSSSVFVKYNTWKRKSVKNGEGLVSFIT